RRDDQPVREIVAAEDVLGALRGRRVRRRRDLDVVPEAAWPLPLDGDAAVAARPGGAGGGVLGAGRPRAARGFAERAGDDPVERMTRDQVALLGRRRLDATLGGIALVDARGVEVARTHPRDRIEQVLLDGGRDRGPDAGDVQSRPDRTLLVVAARRFGL